MRRVAFGLALVFAAGCGSSTTSSGSPTPTPGGNFCGSFQVGPGLECDTTTNPPTLKIVYGDTTGTVAAGDDPRIAAIDPDKGKFLGEFTPSTTQANPPTLASPGGLMTGRAGGIIYNAGTGRIGVRAANEICAQLVFAGHTAAVASAHACTNSELIANVHAGNIPEGATGMAFNDGGDYEYDGTNNPIGNHTSLKGSCGNWTYDSIDQYKGTIWQVVDSDPKTIVGPGMATEIEFHYEQSCGGGLPANTALAPIACCE